MGNLMNSNEQQIHNLLKEQYQILEYPSLMHRLTKQNATIYKITAKTQFESNKIRQTIQQYKHSKCQSILKLRSHYYISSSGYCSDDQNYYLVFDGKNDYTLHEQYLQRRLQGRIFNEIEIIQIIETYLSGLRQYDHRFQSQYQNVFLSSVIIDQQSLKMYLKDPSINKVISNYDNIDNRIKMFVSYPSPQKINSSYNSSVQDYNEFLSNLFSIGIIALQLSNLQFVDDIYIKKREVDYGMIRQKINKLNNPMLKKGVQCLVDFNPMERKRIYQIWGIQNREQHFLQQSSLMRHKNNQKIFAKQPSIIIKPPPTNQHVRSISQPQQKNTNTIVNIPYQPNNPNLSVPNLQFSQYNNPSIKFRSPTPTKDHSINYQNPTNNMYLPKKEPQKPFTNPNTMVFNTTYANNQRPKYSFKETNFVSSQSNKLPQKPFNFQDFMKKQNQFDKKSQIIKGSQLSSFKLNTSNNYPAPSTTSTIPRTNFDFLYKYEPYNPTSTLSGSKPIQYKSYQTNNFQSSQPFNSTSNKNGISNVSLNGALAPFKQSITYYDNRNSNGQNIPTYLDNLKERDIQSILIDEKKDYLPTFYTKKEDYIQPITLTEKEKVSNVVSKAQTQQNHQQSSKVSQNMESPIIVKNQEIKYQENHIIQELPANNTPRKPTGKNKFNSTIVQVRDEDSPDHSFKSEEPALEEEYVVEEYETGSRYEGFKSNNMRNGRGKFYYQDGGYYEGQWKNNKMDGYGKLYYEGGKLAYEGNWYQDQFNGQGKVYNDNPVYLSQPFDYTNFDQLQDFWEYYEGTLARDTKEGRGKIKLSNGELFEGDFHNDRIQGFGKFYTSDNRIVEGIWRQSRLIKIIKSDL